MSIRVVLADDHRLMRQGLRSMLEEQSDVEVVGEADDGRTAVRLASESQPDAVIMDITMPGLNGIDAARQIHADNPGIKIIALSMHSERQFVVEMLAAGASGYLPKDCPVDELLSAIETVVRGDVFLSPKITGDQSAAPAAGGSQPGFGAVLSPREREVLQLVAEGKNAKEIGQKLGVSAKTVEGHRRQVMEKLKLYSVAELTRYAIREGITSLS